MDPLQSIWAWRFWREYRCSTRRKTWAIHQGWCCSPYRAVALHMNLKSKKLVESASWDRLLCFLSFSGDALESHVILEKLNTITELQFQIQRVKEGTEFYQIPFLVSRTRVLKHVKRISVQSSRYFLFLKISRFHRFHSIPHTSYKIICQTQGRATQPKMNILSNIFGTINLKNALFRNAVVRKD